MRKDFAKSIHDCYRTGRKQAYNTARSANRRALFGMIDNNLEADDQCVTPSKGKQIEYFERVKAGHAITRIAGFNSAPVVGFLNKAVGRAWDEVFSEMSDSGLHHARVNRWHSVTDYVLEAVTTKTWKDERGNIFGASGYGGSPRFIEGPDKDQYVTPAHWGVCRSRRFFVHPDTGILCRTNTEKYQPSAHKFSKPVVLIDSNSGFVLHKNTWMRMKCIPMGRMPFDQQALLISEQIPNDHKLKSTWARGVVDALGTPVYMIHSKYGTSTTYNHPVFITEFEPANRKEILQHKLREVQEELATNA